MSDSQFAYSGLTLDELRSLAASPQVGTLHAMPQSFRALADRVGEVADLLTHTQVNMHNWWKGPAAEQAAAMLGQAAAEAREFHDTAMGAATAVSHCVQIVSEQQHQMMNVPEVTEPGVTDVVRQPTTPFEALEVARQDAAYQAAHEQAVQVVNGIAAQYVETRARLSTFSTARGENFALPPTSQLPASDAEPLARKPILSRSGTSTQGASPNEAREYSLATRSNDAHWRAASSSHGRLYGTQTRHLLNDHSFSDAEHETNYHAAPGQKTGSPIKLNETKETFTASRSPLIKTEEALNASEEKTPHKSSTAFNEAPNLSQGVKIEERLNTRPQRAASNSSLKVYEERKPGNEANRIRHYTRQTSNEVDVAGLTQPSSTEQPGEQNTYTSPLGAANTDNAITSMIPPYGGVGSARNLRDARNPRPSYLKERKSTWLTETIAAPPDGVLTPEWFEQS